MSKDNDKNQEQKPGKMKRKEFGRELEKLQVELVKLQQWVVQEGLRVIIVFEGRDAAGKGGTIKRIVDRVSPRVFRVVALPKPTEREKAEMYFQRYMAHYPAAGEFIIENGIILIKYWLEVSEEEQDRRFKARINDGRKIWKLSPMDVESHRRWYDFSRARDAMFEATDTPESPWYVIDSNDKKRARLNCIAHLLSLIPYKELPTEEVKLGNRHSPNGYKEPERAYHLVPEVY